MQGACAHPHAMTELKHMLPCKRSVINEMWDEHNQVMRRDPRDIGNLIRASGLQRSGQERGLAQTEEFFDSWQGDLSHCRTHVSITEVMTIFV